MQVDGDSYYTSEEKATYKKIKDYIAEHYNLKVSILYIAQIKDKCGLNKQYSYNSQANEIAKVPYCPIAKEVTIMDTFKHFNLI